MARIDSKQLRSAEKSAASECKRLEEEWESLTMKGFKMPFNLLGLETKVRFFICLPNRRWQSRELEILFG